MKDKYEVNQYIGAPLEESSSGAYEIKRDENGQFKLHSWRTGKHTKGKYQHPGQIFITENNMMVVVVQATPVPFKKRHAYTPLQRFTTAFVSETVLAEATAKLTND